MVTITYCPGASRLSLKNEIALINLLLLIMIILTLGLRASTGWTDACCWMNNCLLCFSLFFRMIIVLRWVLIFVCVGVGGLGLSLKG